MEVSEIHIPLYLLHQCFLRPFWLDNCPLCPHEDTRHDHDGWEDFDDFIPGQHLGEGPIPESEPPSIHPRHSCSPRESLF